MLAQLRRLDERVRGKLQIQPFVCVPRDRFALAFRPGIVPLALVGKAPCQEPGGMGGVAMDGLCGFCRRFLGLKKGKRQGGK